MEPVLYEGDIVAWTPTKIEDVRVGDIIVFKSRIHWPDEKILVHRVSDIITTSSGKIRLETKGDKNDYTDQAGPHIPEPYITENYLMGKILSIGQVPLKIPFIGYLGVWINQGLTSISQPSSSKESASYIGIFAPLTISVVILVVLLFVLPEKATTIKEKLHLNIFGRRPLNIKRTLTTFLIAYIIFLFVIHCFAYEALPASVGVEDQSPNLAFDFGRIGSGEESPSKELPLINPSTMPVKGVVFCKGDMSRFVSPQIFQLETGEEKSTMIKAVAPSGTTAGGYSGDMMIYSSPFWLIFPDDFMQGLADWTGQATVFILDIISAIILTAITFFILISVTFAGEKISNWNIDRSWYHPSKLIIKRITVKKVSLVKNNFKQFIGRGVGWLINVDLSKITKTENFIQHTKKPIMASLVIIPVFFFLEDKMLAMVISVIIAGALAYFISCKIRSKIILTVLIVMSIAITHMMIQSNLIILSEQHTTLEIMALSTGAIGIYLIVLSILLIPLALASWLITRYIRNLKEQKDPLLSLEGRCDL